MDGEVIVRPKYVLGFMFTDNGFVVMDAGAMMVLLSTRDMISRREGWSIDSIVDVRVDGDAGIKGGDGFTRDAKGGGVFDVGRRAELTCTSSGSSVIGGNMRSIDMDVFARVTSFGNDPDRRDDCIF